jgi:hypothetical protein
MKMIYKSVDDRCEFECELTTVKMAFELAAHLDEGFSETQCGQCNSNRLRHVVRDVETQTGGGTYYEMQCLDCGARLDFGQHKNNKTLWCKRERPGEDAKHRGWYYYTGSAQGTREPSYDNPPQDQGQPHQGQPPPPRQTRGQPPPRQQQSAPYAGGGYGDPNEIPF